MPLTSDQLSELTDRFDEAITDGLFHYFNLHGASIGTPEQARTLGQILRNKLRDRGIVASLSDDATTASAIVSAVASLDRPMATITKRMITSARELSGIAHG